MPELPEVTTTVNGINKECKNWTIVDVWTDLAVNKPSRIDFYETIKYLPYFKNFVKQVQGQKINGATRRGKNILINLNNRKTILVHMKMTGHMMAGKYAFNKKSNTWQPSDKEKNLALRDPFNRFVHVVFTLEKAKQTKHLVLCDARKFAKVVLLENDDHHHKHLGDHGPEPLGEEIADISFNDFKQALNNAPAKNRAIKSVLMDIRTIAGIGNIYSDELLFAASVHPESIWAHIPLQSQKRIHTEMLKVLKRGIDFGGDSMSDYRDINGSRGQFQNEHNAYKKTGLPCNKKNCTGTIKRIVVNGRSSHFCSVHQIIYNK